MKWRGRFTLAVGLWLVPIHLAGQKPTVQVEFRFQEATYQSAIEQHVERPRLEDSVAATLIALFADHFRFLSFVGRQNPPPPFRLIVALDRRERSSSAQAVDVGFHVTLVGRDKLDMYWMNFRTADKSLQRVGGFDTVLTEIRLDLAQLTQADWASLVSNLLNTIPIADSGGVWGQSSPVWIIPYRPEDLCLDYRSLLRIQNLVSLSIGTEEDSVVVDARGKFIPPESAPAAYQQMRGSIYGRPRGQVSFPPDSAKVEAVYVTDYRLSHDVCPLLQDPLSP